MFNAVLCPATGVQHQQIHGVKENNPGRHMQRQQASGPVYRKISLTFCMNSPLSFRGFSSANVKTTCIPGLRKRLAVVILFF